MSEIGLAASFAAFAAFWIGSSPTDSPTNAEIASGTDIGVGATEARLTLAAVNFPPDMFTYTPAPTTAISISFLGMNLM